MRRSYNVDSKKTATGKATSPSIGCQGKADKAPYTHPKAETRSVKTAGFLFGSLTHEDTKNKAHSIKSVGFLHSKMDVIWTLKNKIHLFSNS